MYFPDLVVDSCSSENLIQIAADIADKSYIIW